MGCYIAMAVLMPVYCPSVYLFGMPCPGCGMTRAMLLTCRGELLSAYHMNPMIFPIIGFAGYCFICRYVMGIPVKGKYAVTILLGIMIIIVFCIRMYLYFPDRIPYIYVKDNLLSQIIPVYGEMMNRIVCHIEIQ